VQIRFWKVYNISLVKNKLFVNNDYEVDDKHAKMMCNILCYNNKVSAFNPKEKKEINIILQNKLYEVEKEFWGMTFEECRAYGMDIPRRMNVKVNIK